MTKLNFKESEILKSVPNVGFMAGHIKGFNKFTRNSDGKTGVIYCDGMGNFIELSPDKITWNSTKTEFSTKPSEKRIIIKNNDLGVI